MAFPAFTGGVSNLRPAAFLAVYVKPSAAGLWQTLGSISGGVLNVKDFASPDSLGRNRAINAHDFTAKCKMMQCALTEIELLDTICNGANDFLFKLSDAVAITSGSVASAGWVRVNGASVGVKANINADGDPSNYMSIELEWQGTILKTYANEISLYTPSLQDTNFEATSSGGTFHAIGTYTATNDGGSPTLSHQTPCGVSTVTLDIAGGSAPVTISPITNAKIGFDMVAQQDGLRRFLPCSMDINIEYDWMATLNADLLLLGNASGLEVKAIITMLSGLVITLDNQVGIETNFEVSGDMDKNRIVRFTHQGKVLQSSLDGIVS